MVEVHFSTICACGRELRTVWVGRRGSPVPETYPAIRCDQCGEINTLQRLAEPSTGGD